MTAGVGYRIVDEPQPGPLAKLGVDPMWPLFAFMLAGSWLGWVWFVVNGHAVGSPTRRKELVLVAGGVAGAVFLAMLFGWLIASGVLARNMTWVVFLVITLWKLGVSYWLFELQRRSFELYRYFGGPSRNGLAVVALGYLARPTVAGLLPNGFWFLVVM